MAKSTTVGELVDALLNYPRDTPISVLGSDCGYGSSNAVYCPTCFLELHKGVLLIEGE